MDNRGLARFARRAGTHIRPRLAALVRRGFAASPDRLALALAGLAGQAEWLLRPGRRERTVGYLTYALAGTPREGEATQLARRHFVETRRIELLTARPAISRRGRVLGAEILERLRADGHGVLVMHTHVNWVAPTVYTLSARGFADAVVTGAYDAGDVEFAQSVVAQDGCEVLVLGGAYERMLALVRAGKFVHIAFDAPGSMPCTLLGKPARLGSGLVRLALESGAPIVPVTTTPPGLEMAVRAGAPIRPADFADAASLAARLADVASADILRCPECWELFRRKPLWPEQPVAAPSEHEAARTAA